MKFRPCIDIHNGKVKQIVGGSLSDDGDRAIENFVSEHDGAYYAEIYKDHGLCGGHVIILNGSESQYYEESKQQALSCLRAYPEGLMVGGSITPENAEEYLKAGASHVIVTSYVFRDGMVDYDRLEELVKAAGKEHLVLDLSCRKRDGDYYVVTDRWQKFTDEKIWPGLLDGLRSYADEFLIHGVDAEGQASGVERELVELLGSWSRIPVTYAGGIGSYSDLEDLRVWGRDRLDVTIGSALDLFGGEMQLEKVLEICK
ncbi:MAG: phosphoribosylformimino-5-aminoimidazole carboxamide ribotide isomerase [Lachnospiraceae bacterium]|nr:phosphoribosylformimino-5-aminoimidazole carboxamide ribotide isomerase [Lachnospiraceae bacterium]